MFKLCFTRSASCHFFAERNLLSRPLDIMIRALRTSPATIARVFRLSSVGSKPYTSRNRLPTTVRISPQLAVSSRCFHASCQARQGAGAAVQEDDGAYSAEPSASSKRRLATTFQELLEQGLVHESIVRPITDGMGLTTMTPVQALTINETLKGIDVFVL